MARKGKALESLISSIEKTLNISNAKIESPKYLVDRTTNRKREFDVVLTFDNTHHKTIIAIECRDWAKRVGSPQIEQYHQKCQDAGVNKGVIVSPVGFTSPGLIKAKHLGIDCFGLVEAKSFNWLLAQGIHVRQRNLLHIIVKPIPERELKKNLKGIKILNKENHEITLEIIKNNIANYFKENVPEEDVGCYKREINFKNDDFILYTDNYKRPIKLKSISVDVYYEVKEELVPFKLMEYKNISTDEKFTSAAVAEFNMGKIKRKLAIVYDVDKGGAVYLITS